MCPECEVRRKAVRDAWVNGRIAAAAGHVVKGAAEMAGLKRKTGAVEGRPRRAKRQDSGAAG